jgi:catechol 2,3-dioxygenase-like lactoylglutathione lyase family enzyme
VAEIYKTRQRRTPTVGDVQPRITVLTIGVDNLDRALQFYRDGLGFQTEGIIGQEFEYGAVAFFKLQPGLMLAIFPRESIARDARLPKGPPSATEFTLGHNVRSTDEVDQVMAQALAAGARIVKPADRTFWGGYAGYFQDPDEHLWEVVWNPELLPEN